MFENKCLNYSFNSLPKTNKIKTKIKIKIEFTTMPYYPTTLSVCGERFDKKALNLLSEIKLILL